MQRIQGRSVVFWGLLITSVSWAGPGKEPGTREVAWGSWGPSGSSFEVLKNTIDQVQADVQVSVQIMTRSGETALSLQQRTTDPEMETTKFQAYFKGLEVVGSMVLHHRTPYQTQIQNRIAHFDLDTTPRLTSQEALAIAQARVPAQKPLSAPELKILPSNKTHSARLVYWIHFKGQAYESGTEMVINAHTGELIAITEDSLALDASYTLPPVEVYQATDRCQTMHTMDGYPILKIDLPRCEHTISRGKMIRTASWSAQRASLNAKQVLSYYWNTHHRDGLDGHGGEVTSAVHVGHRLNNAAWNPIGKFILYGDGDGTTRGDYTAALDVAGHELTHAIVSETANLMKFDESGALNEAYADFFGKMVAPDDWAFGRQVFLDPKKSNGIRNLADPHLISIPVRQLDGSVLPVPSPAHMAEKFIPSNGECSPGNDFCFVHVNATIPGHASYLVYQAIGKEKAERLYYLTLTHYLTSTSDFENARDETLVACSQLYNDRTCELVRTAFAQVGL